jgi:excinuclease ABC subunit B
MKEIKDITDRVRAVAESRVEYRANGAGDPEGQPALPGALPKDELIRLMKEIEGQMRAAAKQLEFEKAAQLRDQLVSLKGLLQEVELEEPKEPVAPRKPTLGRNR